MIVLSLNIATQLGAERSLYIADEFDFLKLEIDNLLNLAYIHKRFGENQFTVLKVINFSIVTTIIEFIN